MGSIIAFLITKGIAPRFARPLAYAGLALLLLAMLGTALCAIRKDAVEDHQTKIEARARPATDKAADERARDTIAAATNERITRDEIAAQPDQPISPTSRTLACRRLSNAGRDLPAACRPERSDGAQARPD